MTLWEEQRHYADLGLKIVFQHMKKGRFLNIKNHIVQMIFAYLEIFICIEKVV